MFKVMRVASDCHVQGDGRGLRAIFMLRRGEGLTELQGV